MAIDELTFYKNNSGMYDEMIALRLGLIPLTTDLDSYVLPEECDCPDKNCAKCAVEIMGKFKGPGVMYAKDLEFSDPNIKPVYPDIPIVKLKEGQEVEFTGYARLGKGEDHAKHSPGYVYYRNIAKIETNGVRDKVIYEFCPKKVFDENLNVVNPEACDLCMKCVDLSEGKIKVEPINDEFIFVFENFGQLPTMRVFEEAIKVLNKDLDALEEALE